MHLQILQLLSAHMKLLLDAPEHLWRLIERKKFFQAAWLFLLARVVHRALVREDEQDEGSWSRQGVDVLVRMLNPLRAHLTSYLQSQFPLIQRQWEVISQFRFQIVHKATLSLREDSSSVEVCSKYSPRSANSFMSRIFVRYFLHFTSWILSLCSRRSAFI